MMVAVNGHHMANAGAGGNLNQAGNNSSLDSPPPPSPDVNRFSSKTQDINRQSPTSPHSSSPPQQLLYSTPSPMCPHTAGLDSTHQAFVFNGQNPRYSAASAFALQEKLYQQKNTESHFGSVALRRHYPDSDDSTNHEKSDEIPKKRRRNPSQGNCVCIFN